MSRTLDSVSLQALVRERIDDWHLSGQPDAASVLAEHPELRGAKSLVMDLVLAEFNLRTAAGDTIAKSTFCDRFPAYRQSIAKMLQVQEFLDECPQFAIEEQRARWPVTGDEFLGYEIVEPLGRGGLARVFLARELAVGGRNVVVKISRFATREAHTLGKLSHPSIVPIYSVQHDAEAGWTLICMPLVGVATAVDLLDAAQAAGVTKRDGRLVARVAREARPLTSVTQPAGAMREADWNLPYADAIARVGLQLAEALEAAHTTGILHRDIKPSNVLLAWTGRAMLLDFNLSIDVAAAAEGIGGTLAYMAPELIACLVEGHGAAARRFDPRCDLYSLGVVLFELLSGQLPARPENAERLPLDAYEPWLESKRTANPRLSAAELAIDPRLAAIVHKCLALEPDERYATAAELATDLRAHLGKMATLSRFARRNRRMLLLAAVALLGSGVGLGTYIANRPTPLELAYRQGLDAYGKRDYEAAVVAFTRCLELKPGWPHARFGRAQALRRQEKYPDAKVDYKAFWKSDAAWASAFAGYCDMQVNDIKAAEAEFFGAHRQGLRNVDFLFNMARNSTWRQFFPRAVEHYSEIIDIEPQNCEALINRALNDYYSAINSKDRLPSQQAMDDVRKCCTLAPDSFEVFMIAAVVLGEAARKDSSFESEAIAYLSKALTKGMPQEVALNYPYYTQLKRLVPLIDADVFANAKSDPSYRVRLTPVHEPPNTADWEVFQRQFGHRREMLAASN